MSFLNILGGVGAGLRQGATFMQQKNMQDEQLRMAQERNTMLAEENSRRATEFDQKQAEYDRVQKLSGLRNSIHQNYPDANQYQREQMFVNEGVKSGLFKGAELDAAYSGVENLKKQFGAEAYGAAINGDIKPLQQILGQKGIAIDYDPSGKNLLLWQDGGARDATGTLQPRTIPVDGLLQMDVMSEARRRQQEARKAALEGKAEIAKIDLDEAKAEALRNKTAGMDANGNVIPAAGGTGRAGKAGKAAEATEEAVPSVDAGDVAKLMGNAEGAVLSRVAADAESMMMATPGLRKNPMMAIELARRLSLPDDDKAKLRPLPVKNPATGEWYMEFDEPTLGKIRLGRTGGGGIDPEKNLTSDQNEAKNQRALIQAQDEDWLAAVAQTAPPAVMGYLGPYLNGQQSPSELTSISDQDIAAVLNSPLAPQELKDKAMAAQLVKSRPGFFSTAQRINKNAPEYMDGRRPKPAFAPGSVPADKAQAVKRQYAIDQREEVRNAAGSGPSANAEAYARADGDAATAMMLLRTNNPTLKAEQAVKALQAIEEFPRLKSELKVSENELWALKLTAGGNGK